MADVESFVLVILIWLMFTLLTVLVLLTTLWFTTVVIGRVYVVSRVREFQ